MRAVTITAGVVTFLLVMAIAVLVAVTAQDYWGVACIPAGGLIGGAVAWATRKHGR